MHCWSLHELIDDLKSNTISSRDALLYLLGFVLFNFLGLSVFNWLLDLYHITIQVIKDYLEQKTQGTQLFIMQYDFYDGYLMGALLLIITVGIITCWKANSDRQHFMKRFICISWVINIRLLIMLSMLYLIGLAICISIYLPHLLGLIPPSFDPKNPVELFIGLIKNLGAIKPILDKVTTLQKGIQLLKSINSASKLIYQSIIGITILASIWYFIRIRQTFKRIALNSPA